MSKDENTNDSENSTDLEEPKNYYDKRDSEEESIFEFDSDVQKRYEKVEQVYNNIIPSNLYEDAKENSMSERVRLGIKEDDNFVYGEMTFRSLSYICETVKKTFGEKSLGNGDFYDLGSVNLNLK